VIRQFAKRLFSLANLEPLHRSEGRVAELLLAAYRDLRFSPNNLVAINRAHSVAYLAQLLKIHSINSVIDVGANIGQFGSELRELGYSGEIHSFEPNPTCFARLAERASADPLWKLYQEGIGSTQRTASLHIFKDDTFGSFHRINQAGSGLFGSLVEQTEIVEVRVTTLDSAFSRILEGADSRSILIKSDTQGHDLEVLRGAAHLLAVAKVVVTEAPSISIYDDTESFSLTWQMLFDAGYMLSCLSPIGNRASDLAMIEFDCFFVRPK
jgi:FkbM family methyltransferase